MPGRPPVVSSASRSAAVYSGLTAMPSGVVQASSRARPPVSWSASARQSRQVGLGKVRHPIAPPRASRAIAQINMGAAKALRQFTPPGARLLARHSPAPVPPLSRAGARRCGDAGRRRRRPDRDRRASAAARCGCSPDTAAAGAALAATPRRCPRPTPAPRARRSAPAAARPRAESRAAGRRSSAGPQETRPGARRAAGSRGRASGSRSGRAPDRPATPGRSG